MRASFLPLSVVFLDVIQLLSFNKGSSKAVAGASLSEQGREMADSLKKWLPSGAFSEMMKEGVSANRMAGKNDKLLMPLSSVMADETDGIGNLDPRKKRQLSNEFIEAGEIVGNAVKEETNFPEPSVYPDVTVTDLEDFIGAPETQKNKS